MWIFVCFAKFTNYFLECLHTQIDDLWSYVHRLAMLISVKFYNNAFHCSVFEVKTNIVSGFLRHNDFSSLFRTLKLFSHFSKEHWRKNSRDPTVHNCHVPCCRPQLPHPLLLCRILLVWFLSYIGTGPILKNAYVLRGSYAFFQPWNFNRNCVCGLVRMNTVTGPNWFRIIFLTVNK